LHVYSSTSYFGRFPIHVCLFGFTYRTYTVDVIFQQQTSPLASITGMPTNSASLHGLITVGLGHLAFPVRFFMDFSIHAHVLVYFFSYRGHGLIAVK
jgi:hypothetical protein